MRLLPFGLLAALAACTRPTPTVDVDAAIVTTTAASASPSASAAPHPSAAAPAVEVKSTFAVYVGTIGKERATLGVERRGDAVRATFVEGYGEPVELTGLEKADGALSLAERGFLTRKGVSLALRVDPKGAVTGTLVDPKDKTTKKLTLAPGTPFGDKDATFEQKYAGSLGSSTRVRARWKRDQHLISGVYRYARSKDDLKLDGTVIASTGAFELVEKNDKGGITGRWTGVFVAPFAVLARWTSPDGKQSYPLSLSHTDAYPESVTLVGGGKLAPQEAFSERGKACTQSVLYPAFEGLASPAAQATLNGKLRSIEGVGVPLKASDCDGAEDAMPYDMETAYSVTAQRPSFVSLSVSQYAFTGGAHGNWGATCWIADLGTGNTARLGKELAPAALDQLSALTRAQLHKDNGDVAKLTDVGFFDDEPSVSADTSLCVVDDKGALALQVSFHPYEISPWAMGSPSVVIAADKARALFAPGSMGASIFK